MPKKNQPMPAKNPNNGQDLSVGARIRILREHTGLTQQALGELTGFPKAQIGQWERGLRKPGVDSLRGLAEALNGSFLWLALGQGDSRDASQPNGPLLEACVEVALRMVGPEKAPTLVVSLFQRANRTGLSVVRASREAFVNQIEEQNEH
jgi:transcriptional regulator with XRE-family HTH domain